MRNVLDILRIAAVYGLVAGTFTGVPRAATTRATMQASSLGEFTVFEFRRYTLHSGTRANFTKYFDTYFPDVIEQVGAVVAGEFLDRNHPDMFTWIRGFHTLDDRATANAALYKGPVWQQHRDLMNGMIVDSDDVLLLRPLSAERPVTILPAVDPVNEPGGARGVVVAEIFAVKPGEVEQFANIAEPLFAKYRAAGAHEAGVFVTLDVPNNYPKLPVRTDGPFLVWVGLVKDDVTLEASFNSLAADAKAASGGTDFLRDAPEILVMDPAPRSRMRWLP